MSVVRGVGRVPKICDAPLRYERWMFSLLGEGERALFGAPAAAKKGETLEIELSAGESIAGLLDGLTLSSRIHGPEVRFSDTADNTGDSALGDLLRASSFCPSA